MWADVAADQRVLKHGPRTAKDVRRLKRLRSAPMVACSHDPGRPDRWLRVVRPAPRRARPRAARRPRARRARSTSRDDPGGSGEPEPDDEPPRPRRRQAPRHISEVLANWVATLEVVPHDEEAA
jgi:hypothetical protein